MQAANDRGSVRGPLTGWSPRPVIDDALPIYPLTRRTRMLVTAFVVVLVVGIACVWWRYHYGIWPGARYPSALHYCHRTYNRDHDAGSRSAAKVLAEDSRPEQFAETPLIPVFEFDAPLAARTASSGTHPKPSASATR